ncbi:MAG: YkgJ family cysteine cluster protein [Elusimicrobiota bacterium]
MNIIETVRSGKLDFKCRNCSNCCSMEGYVFISRQDVEDIAGLLGVGRDRFVEKYTADEGDRIRIKGDYSDGCIFLDKGICVIYPGRPEQCRTFPFWLENLKSQHALESISGYCSGIKAALAETECKTGVSY